MRSIALMMLGVAALSGQDGFRPLFNGKNLDEWIVDTPGLWRVEGGTIVGTSPGLKYNDFLRTRKHYGDFVLRATFKMVDQSGQGNSGIQFRSKPVPDSHEVSGYQADIGQKYWGCLYDESRRNRVLAGPSAEAFASVKRNDWNELVVTARGNRITIDLNGIRSVDYTEQDAAIERSGFIALQLHSGPQLEMHFKNLTIREIAQ